MIVTITPIIPDRRSLKGQAVCPDLLNGNSSFESFNAASVVHLSCFQQLF
jgi:hypothetical protein